MLSNAGHCCPYTVYLDDILIYSGSEWEHKHDVHKILCQFQQHHLYLLENDENNDNGSMLGGYNWMRSIYTQL